MYLWFFKKVSSMFFLYVLHDVMLHDVLFVRTNPCFICQKFHGCINNILCEHISSFCSGCQGPLHGKTILKLYFLALSFAQNSLTCSNELAYYSKTLGRTWNNHIANNIFGFHLIKTMTSLDTLSTSSHVDNNFNYCLIMFWIHNHIKHCIL